MSHPIFRLAISALFALPLAAQESAPAKKIPLRPLGPVVATSKESVGEGLIIRGLPNGRLLVGSLGRQRVYAFDSTLSEAKIVIDSGTGTGTIPIAAVGLIPFTADSTLVADINSQSLLVLDAMGKTVRVMAPPRPQDLIYLMIPQAYGRAGLDPQGRLIYRTILRSQPKMTQGVDGGAKMESAPIMADSSPIVRGDLDSRSVDTVGWASTPSQGTMSMDQKPNNGGMTIKLVVNPFPIADEWALLTDGTIAIVRSHDYHIDWVYPDGTKKSSPKMPFDWKRYTEEEKQHYADSVKVLIDSQVKMQASAMPSAPGQPKMSMTVDLVPPAQWPDYYAPIKSGSVLADLNNHVWILPTTSLDAVKGFTYDIVDRNGEVIDRVQLPLGRVLAGFGPNGAVYLAHTDGKVTYIERALLRSPGPKVAGQ